jgi:nicotinamide-nucleotide amidase
MSITAELITIGDEILYGQTLDTNSHWISGELDQIGIRVIRKTTIPDQKEHILNAFAEAEQRAAIVLITGGLGPTNDDLTKPCIAEFFGVSMIRDASILQTLKERYERSGRELNNLNKDQALLPEGATVLHNELGTAPGIWMERGETIFVAMPGVPFEMKGLIKNEVLPRLLKRFVKAEIHHRIIRTGGIPESTLAEKLSDWERQLPAHIKLAYLPTLAQVKLRLTAVGGDIEILKAETEKEVQNCLKIIDKYVYATENIEIQERIGQLLRARGMTIACAESCTGGYISHLITSTPGSSDYFVGSCIPYSYEMKEKVLNVKHETLMEHGAVSEETIREMSENIRLLTGASIGLATSGIAGPGGATPDKPIGTIWISLSDAQGTISKKYIFMKDRKINIQLGAMAALNMVRSRLDGMI